MRRPWSRIAARCSPRAMNVTSTPAAASRPPKYPPTPPLPTIAIRMARILYTFSGPPEGGRFKGHHDDDQMAGSYIRRHTADRICDARRGAVADRRIVGGSAGDVLWR